MAELRFHTRESGRLASDQTTLENVTKLAKESKCAWLDILKPDEKVRQFLLDLGIDELAVEDCFGDAANTVQGFDNHNLIVVKARDADNRLDTEPIVILEIEDLLITVRHTKIPAVNSFAARFKRADDEELALGTDYLLYEILDAIADDWVPILNEYSDELDELEYRVFDPAKKYDNLLESLHELKKHLREASKSIESLQSALLKMLKPGERMVSKDAMRLFVDLQQMTTTLVKRASNYSAGATSTRDTYLSHVNLKLAESNAQLTEVMTTLTIIGAIMLPLTLIAGIFGMNVEAFEAGKGFLDLWQIIGLMGTFCLVMLLYFWRRGWLARLRNR